jgi:cyclopropane fatty-acyl-phospholipid synthase-like methyltransferase
VQPIVQAILKAQPKAAVGLDFGAGTGPVIAQMLKKEGYDISLYDPFFYREKEVLNSTYDFIICCEVIEHFHDPATEFALLKKLLKPGGRLFCMTHLLTKKEDFKNWYYKNDFTHVIFYTPKTLQWIQKKVGFKHLSIDNRLIRFY